MKYVEVDILEKLTIEKPIFLLKKQTSTLFCRLRKKVDKKNNFFKHNKTFVQPFFHNGVFIYHRLIEKNGTSRNITEKSFENQLSQQKEF